MRTVKKTTKVFTTTAFERPSDSAFMLNNHLCGVHHANSQNIRVNPLSWARNPQQNGRHERMHLTHKKEATKPAAAANFLQQQDKFDDFIACYNNERPHQALDMKYPAELYASSTRSYRGLGELAYPFHDETVTVTRCGRICFDRLKINLSTVFAGQNVGIRQVADKIWLVTFMQYDLGYFDHETTRLEPIESPFRTRVLPMSPV